MGCEGPSMGNSVINEFNPQTDFRHISDSTWINQTNLTTGIHCTQHTVRYSVQLIVFIIHQPSVLPSDWRESGSFSVELKNKYGYKYRDVLEYKRVKARCQTT
jgi:hypothetical protein